jgi:concentrative nucleoside transporter, CNT family
MFLQFPSLGSYPRCPMISPDSSAVPVTSTEPIPQPTKRFAPMPVSWRVGLLVAVAALGGLAYALHGVTGPRGQAGFGILCFLGIAAAFSKNLRAVSLKTFLWGVGLQFALALAVTQGKGVKEAFEWIGEGIKVLIACSDKGAEFVFGDLAKVNGPISAEVGSVAGGPGAMTTDQRGIGARPFVFAFKALPPIIFVSAFFSVLYHFGVLQFLVKLFAKGMMYLMGTSGAETLSVSANVFMGQTEAPLIVKPFVPRMTESELLTLMASGMAHISGGMMAVYISYGADPASILCTCVMACPCSLYLSKLVLPELAHPVTAGDATIRVEKTSVNPIDAAATGVKDGLFLALNVAAMLIGFIAFIALFDAIIGVFNPDLSLKKLFGYLFRPVAFLMGVPTEESLTVGQLLGTKLAANEHVAYLDLKAIKQGGGITERSHKLAVYALTGFANFASIGIQLGGIGAMAPERRKDLARLGLKALFVGFLVTLINAAVAGLLLGTN